LSENRGALLKVISEPRCTERNNTQRFPQERSCLLTTAF
jgi:hypothetical protein